MTYFPIKQDDIVFLNGQEGFWVVEDVRTFPMEKTPKAVITLVCLGGFLKPQRPKTLKNVPVTGLTRAYKSIIDTLWADAQAVHDYLEKRVY